MIPKKIHILLAEDDNADILLFKDALDELPISATLSIVKNGEELINKLTEKGHELPDVLFLDLNMPRKNGFASLGQIKRSTELQNLPVIILSSASGLESIRMVFRNAAHYYICKPSDFSQLKRVIYETLTLITQKDNPLPGIENFKITGDSITIPEKI